MATHAVLDASDEPREVFEQASCSSVGDGAGKGLSAAESKRALRRPRTPAGVLLATIFWPLLGMTMMFPLRFVSWLCLKFAIGCVFMK